MSEASAAALEVRFRNDLWQREGQPERTNATVNDELASLFAFARSWAADAERQDDCDLTFSAMLAAMVAHDKPLCRWLRRYFDALGVPSDDITGGRTYPSTSLDSTRLVLDHELTTTHSFRTAFAKAEELRDLTSPGQPIAVRHFMAAYPVCRDYHLRDFRRYRIDRREWCLRLADELIDRHPDEAVGWKHYRSMAPPLLPLAFDNDTPDGRDHLHLEREVTAFARLITARSTSTPLSIGVFGAWGSGKSFFMHRTREQVADIARAAAGAGPRADHHARIAQVEFNAWHYSETDLISSLVDHIFRNLRIDPLDDDDETLRHRGEDLMGLLVAARGRLDSAESGVSAAMTRLRAAEGRLVDAQASLPTEVGLANQALARAEDAQEDAARRLATATEARDAAMRRTRASAGATAWLAAVAANSTDTEIKASADELGDLIKDAHSTRLRWRPIAVGAALLVLTVVFAALSGTRAWGQVASVVTAIGAFVTLARTWLTRLGQLGDTGDRFLAERRRLMDAEAARVGAHYDDEIASLAAVLAARSEATEAARQQLESTASMFGATAELDARRSDLTAARDGRTSALRDVAELQSSLAGNTIDSLLREFLDERHDATDYRARLGVFSQVRNDFERLSTLIARATDDFYEHGKPPPAVSRIVLYIDDLDRCPEEKVVEVLRAVHLLLAFPLFVCVVAVDPRWLSACLANAAGITSGKSVLDAQFGRPAEAADYIEKIFQVPLWLRPVPSDRRAALVRSWLDDRDVVDVERPPLAIAELEFLDELRPMLDGKPRTLKRLANTYRLVKTALSDVEFRTFTSSVDDAENGCPPYRTCLTQLAVLNADRRRAITMIDSLEAESSATTVEAWLESLAKADADLASFLRGALGRVDRMDLAEFRLWLERTRRYSFYL
jgi:hypothetical protein